MSVILERQNAIAEQIMGSAGRGWLVSCVLEAVEHQDWYEPYRKLIANFHMQRQWSFLYEPVDEVRFEVHATPVRWQPNRFDEVLADIAEDKLRALWIAESSGSIFAPYDGGVDCILPTPVATAALRDRFSSWLSSHPEGL